MPYAQTEGVAMVMRMEEAVQKHLEAERIKALTPAKKVFSIDAVVFDCQNKRSFGVLNENRR